MSSQQVIGSDVIGVLKDIAARENGAVLGNRRRLFGLLRDKLPSEVRTIQFLMTAFDEGVPARLRANSSLGDAALAQEVTRVASNTGMAPEFAEAAVTAWAQAIAGYAPAAPAAASDWIEPVQAAPARTAAVQPAPVAPLPVQPAAPSPAGASGTSPVLVKRSPWVRIGNIVRITAAVIIMLGAILKLATSFGLLHSDDGSSSTGGGGAETTADGVPIIGGSKMPVITTQRLGSGGEIMSFDFAIKQGSDVISYSVAMRFQGAQSGTGAVVATKDGKSANSGNVALTRTVNGDKTQSVQLVGRFAENPINATPVCVTETLGPNLARPEVQSGKPFCAAKVSSSGSCEPSDKLGCAYLQ
jgi:hypothetical protein